MFRFPLTALDNVVFSSSSEKALINLLLLNPNRQTVSSQLVNIEQHLAAKELVKINTTLKADICQVNTTPNKC